MNNSLASFQPGCQIFFSIWQNPPQWRTPKRNTYFTTEKTSILQKLHPLRLRILHTCEICKCPIKLPVLSKRGSLYIWQVTYRRGTLFGPSPNPSPKKHTFQSRNLASLARANPTHVPRVLLEFLFLSDNQRARTSVSPTKPRDSFGERRIVDSFRHFLAAVALELRRGKGRLRKRNA